MADIRNIESDNKDNGLKNADAEKSDSRERDLQNAQEILGEKLVSSSISAKLNKENKEKKLPVVVDVVIAIILLSVFIGVVVGAYFLFRYYADDYSGVDVEYTMVVPCGDDWANFETMKHKEIYLDGDDNTYYFGSVKEVLCVENEKGNYVVILIETTAKYNEDEGYTISGNRIAVGCTYNLRSENAYLNGTIVELSRVSLGGK